MTANPPNSTDLCFYKLLLLKSDIFENGLIDLTFLEKETGINHSWLIEPLKNLLEGQLISFSNEVLSGAYIGAYKEKRRMFELREYRKKAAGAIVGGHANVVRGSNHNKKTELWKNYYTDENCELDKEVFDKLARDKRINIRIDEKMLGSGREIMPISYIKFNLNIDKNKLAQYLDDYLSGYIEDKYNDGEKYSYPKQKQEINLAIQKLIGAGYSAKSLLIDSAQIFPENKMEVRPTDGLQLPSILLCDFLDTVLGMEKEGLLKILDIIYQEKTNKGIIHSGQLWEAPLKIRVALNKKSPDIKWYEKMLTDDDKKNIRDEIKKITADENLLEKEWDIEYFNNLCGEETKKKRIFFVLEKSILMEILGYIETYRCNMLLRFIRDKNSQLDVEDVVLTLVNGVGHQDFKNFLDKDPKMTLLIKQREEKLLTREESILAVHELSSLSGVFSIKIKFKKHPPLEFGDFDYNVFQKTGNNEQKNYQMRKTEESIAPKQEGKVSDKPLPKFHFNQGVLFRDFCNDVLEIKGENTQEYRLLQVAVGLPVDERIDACTKDIEMEWRQLYDTARRLNGKIKDTFKIDVFFQVDFQNKKLHRLVE